MTTFVGGLDLSLTSSGLATATGVTTIKPGALVGVERMVFIRDTILMRVAVEGLDVLMLEAPSYNSKGRSVKEVGGIWWIVRVALHERFDDLEVAEVPPATLKKFATGKGNAGKELVLVEAVKRLGYEGSSTDEADALWLEAMGLSLYTDLGPTLPQAHMTALEALG